MVISHHDVTVAIISKCAGNQDLMLNIMISVTDCSVLMGRCMFERCCENQIYSIEMNGL